jgi:hypothetical protein
MMMAKKRKSAGSYIAEKLKTITRSGGAPYPYLPSDIPWDDPVAWLRHARNAFNPRNLNGAIKASFDNFKLDPRNPYHWRMLLFFFAEAHFRERESRGRPKQWTSQRLCDLLRQVSDARKKRPNANQSDVFRSLVKPKAPYEGQKPDALKHAYARALKPQHNKSLFDHRDAINEENCTIIKLAYDGKGISVPDAIKKAVKDLALSHALKAIGAPNALW